MKKTNTIIAFLLVLVAVVGCKKDTDPAAEEPEVKVIKVTPRQHGATFEWDVVDMPGKFQTCVELSRHDDMSDLLSLPAYETETSFVANIDTLTANTTYYYRYVVWNKFKRFEFEKGGTPFTTLETPTPGQDTTYYTISVSWQPEEGGMATGGGRYTEGDTCTLTATANEGYRFVNWTEGEGNSVADTAAIFSFVVTADRALVANFVEESAVLYTVTAIAEPTEGGTVTGSGTYEEGQSCTLTATANECYEFVKWTKGDEEIQDSVYTFTVTDMATCVAHFRLKRYTVTAVADPTDGGSAIGGNTYDCGETCTVRAIEAQGYTFVNWTENGEQAHHEREYTFTVKRSRDLVANFVELQPNQYLIQVVIDPSEGGTVIGNGPYNEGQTCTLTATPHDCYEFVNWTKDDEEVSQQTDYTFTVNDAATYVAHFRLKKYEVTVSAGTGGSAYVGEMQGVFSQNVDCGDPCTVHAIPEPGYKFEKWTENGEDVDAAGADYTINVIDNHNLTAHFTQETYTITVNAGTGGTASGGGQYHYGETATLTATPTDDCYAFTSWSDGSTDNPYTVRVTGDAEYTADFERLTYTISTSVSPASSGTAHVGSSTGQTSAPFACGDNCTVHAIANTGYQFANWTDNGEVVSTTPDYTFGVTGARTLVANFDVQAANTYTINVSANPSYGGEVTGGGTYVEGESCTVTAFEYTANCEFTSWTEDGVVVSTNLNYTFTVTGDRTLVANFLCTVNLSILVTLQDGNNPEGTVVSFLNLNAQEQQNHPVAPVVVDVSGFCVLNVFPTGSYRITVAKTGYESIVGAYDIYESMDLTFNLTPNTVLAPTGALPGKFTRNANGDKVYFSKGNLQYNKTTQVWSFMEHQYDIVETQGQNVGENYANQNIISLFGWGTSGYHDSNDPYNVNYQPWSTSTDSINGTYNWYGYGPSTNMPSPNLTGSSANYDWGYNAISNGGGQSGQWRTLTGWTDNNNTGEWYYIFFIRSASTVNGVANARYAKAQVAGVHGVILFSDEYTHPGGVAQPVGINETGNTGWNGNNYSASDFALMQDAGAVFLPAAGYRNGTSVYYVGSYGNYWSASYSDSIGAHYVYFDGTYLNTNYYNYRYGGRSVRLVCPAE